jgi:hypothetical protein
MELIKDSLVLARLRASTRPVVVTRADVSEELDPSARNWPNVCQPRREKGQPPFFETGQFGWELTAPQCVCLPDS